MSSTSSLGVGTGVDLQTMLTKIMEAERAPIRLLETRMSTANTKISAYGAIQSKLDSFRSAAETLQFPSRLGAVTATSANTEVVSANAAFTAALGSYTVQVTQMAKAQKSFSVAYNGTSTFSQGTLNFSIGGQAATPIVLDDQASYTLEEVGQRINSAKVGVTATVITDSDGMKRMVLTGDKSGTSNSFSLTTSVTASGDQPSLNSTDFDVTTPGLLRSDAQNGKMKIDGIEILSSTNTFTTGVAGLTMTAVKEGTTNISVQNDASKIVKAAQTFVDSYNAVVNEIKSKSGYDTSTKTAQALSGEATVRNILANLSSARTSVPGELASSSIKTLSELGISIQQNGTLVLNSEKLANAVNTSTGEAINVLNAYGKSFSNSVMAMQTTGGQISNRLSSLNASVSRFKVDQESLENRIGLIEKRYRAQFIALDKYVSAMTVTSNALGQQLATLTGSTSS